MSSCRIIVARQIVLVIDIFLRIFLDYSHFLCYINILKINWNLVLIAWLIQILLGKLLLIILNHDDFSTLLFENFISLWEHVVVLLTIASICKNLGFALWIGFIVFAAIFVLILASDEVRLRVIVKQLVLSHLLLLRVLRLDSLDCAYDSVHLRLWVHIK